MNAQPTSKRQSGAALAVTLILLLVITLLGLASMRGAIMQERMAANTISRSMAFQAAEAGLRQAEIRVRDGTTTFPTTPGTCVAGFCSASDPSVDPPWMASDFWTSSGNYLEATPVVSGDVSITPRYVIEDFGVVQNQSGSDCLDPPCIETAQQNVFRITAYAAAPNGAEVTVQSIYRR